MIASRPYLIRAIYEWLVDNEWTPYLMVNAMYPKVSVPERFVEDGKIILNISPNAVGNLVMNNDAVEFDASFGGIRSHIYVPIKAINAIYAFENGRGMVFHGEDDDEMDGGGTKQDTPAKPTVKKGKPSLKIVK